ncbi:SRPBCC family protein [Dactylosporangium matsuzakiense]|uniref:Polyketide cyclase/dehydrase/lipid transport protein n=1 Tax=Dactylosporangium matsuzakiense TaxID=53360 RepID=A0A9W6KHL0_9ACTN|nr:hypothetical protein GCM10017581_014040 [Dactylosporangium matsuzakiense]
MAGSLVVDGPCGADEVWDRYARPSRWAEWAPQIRGVTYQGEVIAPGAAGVVHGPVGVRVPFRIVAVDADGPVRRWAWEVRVLTMTLWLEHVVEARGTGVRTRLSVAGPAPVVAMYRPVAWAALRRLVR